MRMTSLFYPLWRAYRSARARLERHNYTPNTYPDYLRWSGVQVGRDCRIAAYGMESGIEPYLLKIGNRVVIEKQAACLTHDGATWVFRHLVPDLQVLGPIVLEDDCYVGAAAILCPGVRIGRKAVVAPGSVVICDVPPETVVMGIPARPYGASQTLLSQVQGRVFKENSGH
jgi:acetyltransferase-like isoleucine patch superfamily enzyme